MELEHRFEVPVGIDKAWNHLLDMEQVAACFPGATLTSADGEKYTGTVKVKLGPIQLTYAGSAHIVSADEASHTATIEASGNAARSGSTAAMKVVAVASSVADDRTAVVMKTDLTITGRPAQFGRGVMVEVGSKILGTFADCLAAKLGAAETAVPVESAAAPTGPGRGARSGGAGGAARGGDGAAAAAAAKARGAGEAGGPAAAAEGEAAQETRGEAHAAAGGPAQPARAAGAETTDRAAPSGTYTRAPSPEPSAEPIDLLASARGSIIKRLAPLLAAVVVALVLRRFLRRRHARRDD